MAARVSKDNFEAEVLQASIPVLVEFYSDSCIPCKQMSPILGDIEDDYEDRLKVVKVNANFDGELAEQYSVENPEYVTVTVNDDFVENHDLANVTLKENDVVEFLYFMGGGSF